MSLAGVASALKDSGNDEPVTVDPTNFINNIGNTRAQISQQTQSHIVPPMLDQLITHFGPGPEKAQGELGQLLKEYGL